MSKTNLISPLLTLFVTLFLQGCQPAVSPVPYPGPGAYPSDRLPTPVITLIPKKSAIIGRVFRVSNNYRNVLAHTSIRLAKIQWNQHKIEGIFVLDTANSPGALTRSDGSFTISNIEPGDYVIIVGDVIGVHTIISDSEGKIKIYSVEPDQILDIGTLEIDWG